MSFSWNGWTLAYFDHPYNHTALNMRRVEIPIARAFLSRVSANKRVLEVGNVLSHYGPIHWHVVDLKERGCINRDVMKWKPPDLVDYLVCISTMEHIGFGRYNAGGILPDHTPESVWARLSSFLAPGGRILATVPLSYNQALDEALLVGRLVLTEAWFYRHIGKGNWQECTLQEAAGMSRRECAGRWPGGLAVLYYARER